MSGFFFSFNLSNLRSGCEMMCSFDYIKPVIFRTLTLICLLCVALNSCHEGAENDHQLSIKDLHWVVGEWKGRVKGGMMFEQWKISGDSALTGTACRTSGSDTLFKESMQILARGSDLYYVVKVAHNDSAVSFKLVESTPKGTVFENPDHDFPNRVVYSKTIGDMLLARIEGVRDNKRDTVQFFMHRDNRFVQQ